MSEQTTPYTVDLDDNEYADPTVPVARHPSALEMAQNEVRGAASKYSAWDAVDRTTAYAAIAQAEALERIAVALETANLAAWNIAPHKGGNS